MLSFDMREFERAAYEMKQAPDQIAFALSGALNDALFKTRQHFIDQTWPQHVEVRDRNFLRNALRVERATKRSLRGAVTTEGAAAGNRAHLGLHNKGGTKAAQGRLAIPDPKIRGRRTGKGMPKGLRPLGLPNAFVKGDVVYQRTGGKRKPGLKLMYVLKPNATIKADVPFSKDFERVMRDEVRRAFPQRMAQAMRTRR